MNATHKAAELLRLHTDPELLVLVLVNVWEVASARVVAAQPGCKALATASAAIAASFGYLDGEHIPLDLVLDMTARIVEATDLPVTADLEAGYGDVATTFTRAVAAGVVGANLEDRMRPLPEAVAAVITAVKAAERAKACPSCSTPEPTPISWAAPASPQRSSRRPSHAVGPTSMPAPAVCSCPAGSTPSRSPSLASPSAPASSASSPCPALLHRASSPPSGPIGCRDRALRASWRPLWRW